MVLHIAGFYWICSKKPPGPQRSAPIYVVNHIGIFDSLYFLVWDFPMIVAKVPPPLFLLLPPPCSLTFLLAVLACDRMKLVTGPLLAVSFKRCSPSWSRVPWGGRGLRGALLWDAPSPTVHAVVDSHRY